MKNNFALDFGDLMHLFIYLLLVMVAIWTTWCEVCVCVSVCFYMHVCVSIMPSQGLFISNQGAIDSPDFAHAQFCL